MDSMCKKTFKYLTNEGLLLGIVVKAFIKLLSETDRESCNTPERSYFWEMGQY